jgi:flagellar basal-body rod modification protein FlgD
MSTVNNDVAANPFLQALQNPTPTVPNSSSSTLGKDAFLQLLTTQLRNQDPLSPQDNTAFVSQLAQFSSLESMQNLTSSVDSISSSYQSSQALQASSLVGRSVIVDAGATYVDTSKEMAGSVVIPDTTTATTIKVSDSTGTLVDTIDLGPQKAGTTSFTWDGKDSSGNTLAAGNYSFVANGTINGAGTGLVTYLPATVNSVTTATNGGSMTLNLAGGTSIALSQVQTIGI